MTKFTNGIKIHHPDFPISCIRLIETAIIGNNTKANKTSMKIESAISPKFASAEIKNHTIKNRKEQRIDRAVVPHHSLRADGSLMKNPAANRGEYNCI